MPATTFKGPVFRMRHAEAAMTNCNQLKTPLSLYYCGNKKKIDKIKTPKSQNRNELSKSQCLICHSFCSVLGQLEKA